MPSKKKKSEARKAKKAQDLLTLELIKKHIDETHITEKQRLEAEDLERKLYNFNRGDVDSDEEVPDEQPVEQPLENYHRAPTMVMPKVPGKKFASLDMQRARAEELELKLLEFGDYESRLDNDFLGEGTIPSTSTYKTTCGKFYNTADPSIDHRVIAEGLELKLREHASTHEERLNTDFGVYAKGDFPCEVPKGRELDEEYVHIGTLNLCDRVDFTPKYEEVPGSADNEEKTDDKSPYKGIQGGVPMNDTNMVRYAEDDRVKDIIDPPKSLVRNEQEEEFFELGTDSSQVFMLFENDYACNKL